jgi:hypothetical protein
MRVMSAPVAPFGAILGTEELVGFGFFFLCVLEQSSVPASTGLVDIYLTSSPKEGRTN